MVRSCSAYACYSEKEETKASVFKFPKMSNQDTARWLQFISRKIVDSSSSDLFICEKHFKKNIKTSKITRDLNCAMQKIQYRPFTLPQ